MKIIDFYVDSHNAYFKLNKEGFFYIIIDDERIEIPAEINDDVYRIRLANLEKIVKKEGLFIIGIEVDGIAERLQFNELLKSRASGRYFHTNDAQKKLYITTEGYLNFAHLPEKELFMASHKTSEIDATKAVIINKETDIYLQLTLTKKIAGNIAGVSVVDFDAQKRHTVKYVLLDQMLKIDLLKIAKVGRFQVIIDSETEGKVESHLVKVANQETFVIEVNEGNEVDEFNEEVEVSQPWDISIEDYSFILYSTRQDVDDITREIAVRSVGYAFGNCIELEVNLDMEISDVITRHRKLDKIITLDYQYNEGRLKINFSALDGFVEGDFWIYVRSERGWHYQLFYYDQWLILSEANRHFFVRGTETSARYAYFSPEGLLKYGIKPVSSFTKMSNKTIRFDNLCFLNHYFQIELCEFILVDTVNVDEIEELDFYQNGNILFIRIPNPTLVDKVRYLFILSRNQSFKLEGVDLLSAASANYGLVLFTGWRERLAVKPLNIEYYVTTSKISKKIEVKVPNFRDKNLEMILSDNIEIEKVIAVNRKDLSHEVLEFDQIGQILAIKPRNFKPFIVDSVMNYVFDIVFVTSDGLVMPLVKNHKQLAGNYKKQAWQNSKRRPEMLYQAYINIPGTLSIRVKDNYYAENWEKLPVKNNLILYESQAGTMIADSGYVMFKYLVDNPQFRYLEHIWVIDDEQSQAPETLDEKYKCACRFVIRGTRAYMKALLEAKYLINSSTFPFHFAKKPDQIYISTWHAITVKTLGYDMVSAPLWSARNQVKNFMMSDYIISPNPYMTNVYANSYKLRGIYQGTILEGGYPRNDVFFTTEKSVIIKKLHHFSVKLDPKKPTILYAPTWRGDEIENSFNQIPELKELMIKLKEDYGEAYNVFLKPHPLVFKYALLDSDLQNLLIPNFLDPNEVLTIVDILIADFSSIFVDYLMTDNPVIFYFPDKADYIQERGIYLDFTDLPGPQTENYQQLQKELDRIIAGKKNKYIKKYAAMKERYLSYEDGQTAGRYVERIFRNKHSDKIREINVYDINKKKLLMYIGGMHNNGITSSALNLLNHLDYNKYDVTIMMYINKAEELVNNMKKVCKKARMMFIFGTALYTSKEVVKDEALFQSGFSNEEWQDIRGAYRRNMFYRLFPNMYFDTVIDFNGYGAAVIRHLLSIEARQHFIYLHNEHAKNYLRIVDNKFNSFESFRIIFTLYPYADKLVSVSETLMNENFKALSNVMKKEQLAFARNVIDCEYILEQSQAEIDWGSLKSIYGNAISININSRLNFVTSGRLSTEKNHIALIKAFAKFENEYPGARLFILGKGLLQSDINKAIGSVKMYGKIVMLGHLENPFAFIKKMDYFVLPSLFEGQPMVLLEALVLNKKIMASNIKPNIGVIGDNKYGLLTKGTTSEALYEGLKDLMNQSEFERFDYVKYNQAALEDFYKLIES